MSATVLITYGPAGRCPVQAEGTVNGHEFYFRSRGEHWALRISSDQTGKTDPLNDKASWYHKEPYRGGEYSDDLQFAAGYANEAECREAIQRMADLWLADQTK